MDKELELQKFKIYSDDGEELELKVLEIVTLDGIDYALALPADADENDEGVEAHLMKMRYEDDKIVFEIPDDDEFEAVAKILSDEDCSCGGDCSCHHHE